MIFITVNALLLAVILTLPGWAWTGYFYPAKLHRRAAYWITALLALILSLSLLLSACLFLAGINRLHLTVLLPILGIVACLGFAFDCNRNAADSLRHLGRGLLTCLLFTVLFILLRLTPFHSDWIIGGWDPGVITNQGICIGRSGSAHPPPGLTAPLLAADHHELFTRTLSGLHEAFPGIPVDPETGAWDFYFCPITPLMVALLDQAGGLPMAIITPLFIGVLALLVFSGLTVRTNLLFLTPLLFLLQPILIYHGRTPTSEITELLFLGAFMTLWTHAQPGGLRRWLGCSLMFLAAVNRISFELFGAWLILIVVSMDSRREDRRHAVFDHAALMLGLLFGMAYYPLVSPASLVKLIHIMPTLHTGVFLLLTGALALDVLCCVRRTWAGIRWDLILFGSGLVFFFVVEQCSAAPWAEFRRNAMALSAYTGWLLMAIALPGCWLLFRHPTRSAYWALFFFFALLVVLRHKHAAELYPWALKRYLVYAVPFFALLAGATLRAIWNRRRSRWLAAVLLLGVFTLNYPLCRDAWSTPDHEGISKQLDAVAQNIGNRDIVIADHFRWGTPLALTYGKNVINGERIWTGNDKERIRHAVTLIQEYAGNNCDVYFLTSTSGALSLYSGAIPESETIWSSKPWSTQRIEHHRNNRAFTARQYDVTFQLFKITPERRPVLGR